MSNLHLVRGSLIEPQHHHSSPDTSTQFEFTDDMVSDMKRFLRGMKNGEVALVVRDEKLFTYRVTHTVKPKRRKIA